MRGDEEEKEEEDLGRPALDKAVSVVKETEWSINMQLDEIRRLSDKVELTFECKAKTPEYYFWMNHLKQYEKFFNNKPVASKIVLEKEKFWAKLIQPFIDAFDSAMLLWGKRSLSRKQRINNAHEFLDAECRMACSFYLLLSILGKQKDVWHTPAALKDWQFVSATRNKEQQTLKDAQKHREQDLLFWFRFFGTQVYEVTLKEFTASLKLHIVLVEKQKLYVKEGLFATMVKNTMFVNDKGMVERKSWLTFIKKFGPTLKDVLFHLKGVTSSRDGSLSDWLSFKYNEDECRELIRPPAPEPKAPVKKDDDEDEDGSGGSGGSGDDVDDDEEEEEEENGRPNFIIRVSRDKENFVLHFVETKKVKRKTVQDVAPPCKIFLDEGGYYAEARDRKQYPTLREVLLRHVCEKFGYKKEIYTLNKESENWQVMRKRAEQVMQQDHKQYWTDELMRHLNFDTDEFQQVMNKFLETLDERQFMSEQKAIEVKKRNDIQQASGIALARVNSEPSSGGNEADGGSPLQVVVIDATGVASPSSSDGKRQRALTKRLPPQTDRLDKDDQTDRRRISIANFNRIFIFLDRDRSGVLESDEVMTGLFMLLKPSLLDMAQMFHLSEAFEEDRLTAWLPTESAEGIDKEQFKEVLAETIGKMYTEAKKDQNSEEGQQAIQDAKERDKRKGGKPKHMALTQTSFLAIIFDSFDEVARQCGLIKSSADEEEQSWSQLMVQLLATYAAFPLVVVRSTIWRQTEEPTIARRLKRTRNASSIRMNSFRTQCCGEESKWRKRFQFLGKLILSLFIFTIICVLYYAPLANLVLYHRTTTKVTVLEAYIPFVAVLVAGIVFVVGEAVQANLNKRFAEEEWLMAQLRVRQARVKLSPLDVTFSDMPFDGMRLLDGGNFNSEAAALRLEFHMKSQLDKQSVGRARLAVENVLLPAVLAHRDSLLHFHTTGPIKKVSPAFSDGTPRVDEGEVRISMETGGLQLGVMKAKQSFSKLQHSFSKSNMDGPRVTLVNGVPPSAAPVGKKRKVKNRFEPIPKPYGMAVEVHPDGTSLQELEESIKKKIPLRMKEDGDEDADGASFKDLAKDLSGDSNPLLQRDIIPMPDDLTMLGVMEIKLRHIPAWAIREQRTPADRKKKHRKRSFAQAVRNYYFTDRRRGYTALLVAVTLSCLHVLLPGLYRLHGEGAVAFIASRSPQDIIIAGIFMVCSFPGVLIMLVFLQAATFHYYDLRRGLCAIIDITNPKAAAAQGFTHFLPLDAAVNVEYWSLLRQSAKSKADKSMNTVVATTLIIMVLLMGSAFLRVVVRGQKTLDDFYVLALFDIVVLAVYMVQLLIVLVALNTKVQLGSLQCLERAKLKISVDRNKLQEILKATKAEASEAKGVIHDQDEEEDSRQKQEAIEEQVEALKANYAILESSLSVMKTVDEPIKILGLTVDQVFLTQMLGLLGAGLGSTLFTFMDGFKK